MPDEQAIRRGDERKPLPLHRLCGYRAGHTERHRRAAGSRYRAFGRRGAHRTWARGLRARQKHQRQPSRIGRGRQARVDDARATLGGQLTDWKPQASFDQSFTVNHPLAEVWAFFGNTAEVAACLPGASVSGDTTARHVAGKMRIKVGPIAAEFHGAAEIDRDPATHSGTIHGSGRDSRSDSATRGIIRYRLVPASESATRVDLNVGYRLTGALAQFSRADLVHDIATPPDRGLRATGRGAIERSGSRWPHRPPNSMPEACSFPC